MDKILSIKNGMNKNRVNFEMSQSHIKITKYWLLGLIEGEGSFQLWRSDLYLYFLLLWQKDNYLYLLKSKNFWLRNWILIFMIK